MTPTSSATNSPSPSPSQALVTLPDDDATNTNLPVPSPSWQTILSNNYQVVLYDPASHAVTVRHHETPTQTTRPPSGSVCPYCHQPLGAMGGDAYYGSTPDMRASNYFQLLETANDMSRPATPSLRHVSGEHGGRGTPNGTANGRGARNGSAFTPNSMAEGYFEAFFKEVCRLGMGANGSVFLCQHVLDGNQLGYFAVKKIAVGQSHGYLLKILREVRLLESLRHPNIVTYHHAWLESCQFSSFGPRTPTLFILMQWAEGGSLDDFIDARLGRPHNHAGAFGPYKPSEPTSGYDSDAMRSRSERIRAFRANQKMSKEEKAKHRVRKGCTTAVHLLSAEEVKSLLSDVAGGLSFLHDRSILHLDLKPGNVLLTWDDGLLIPRAMLSDFGTSQDMLQPARSRSGNTGTLEYSAPETLPSPATGLLSQVDSKADMWSLGMILHMMLFFRLPYHYSSSGDQRSNDGGDMERLHQEVSEYAGFRSSASLVTTFEQRSLPASYLALLESLLNTNTHARPRCDMVLKIIKEGKLNALPSREPGNAPGALVQRYAAVPLTPTTSQPYPEYSTAADADVVDDDMSQFSTVPPSLMNDDDTREENEKDRLALAFPGDVTPQQTTPPRTGSPGRRTSRYFTPWFLPDSYRPAAIRCLKSSILVGKIVSLYPYTMYHLGGPVIPTVLTVLAVTDTIFDDLRLSAALGLVHLSALRFIS